jgi:hypothetical protein
VGQQAYLRDAQQHAQASSLILLTGHPLGHQASASGHRCGANPACGKPGDEEITEREPRVAHERVRQHRIDRNGDYESGTGCLSDVRREVGQTGRTGRVEITRKENGGRGRCLRV